MRSVFVCIYWVLVLLSVATLEQTQEGTDVWLSKQSEGP